MLSRYKYNTNQSIQAPKINSADGWYHKIVSLISSYSLSKAIIYALGRFYSYYTEEGLLHHLEKTRFIVKYIVHGEDSGLAGVSEPWIAVTSSTS